VGAKGPKLNVLIHDKISFVGVAHLTRGGRSCSWALYRFSPVSTCSYTCLLHHSMVNTITSGQLCIGTTYNWSAPENCAQSTPFPFPNCMCLQELMYTGIYRFGGSRPNLKAFLQGVQTHLGCARLLGEESLDRSGTNGGGDAR